MTDEEALSRWLDGIAAGVVFVCEERTVSDPNPVVVGGEHMVGTWRVRIAERPFPNRLFGVWSEHSPTGAWTALRVVGSLGAARRKAGELATVLAGSGRALDWRSL